MGDDGAHGRIRTRIFNSDYGSPVRSRRRLRARVGAATGISTPVFFLEREVSWCARRPPRELAPRPGLEPGLTGQQPGVLPLDDRELVDRRGYRPPRDDLQGSFAPLCAARALSWFRSTLSCSSGRRFHQISLQGELERPVGYDPTSSAWRAETLPLSYGRVVGRGRIRTSEPLKGRRLRRRCFGLLHTCPNW